MGQINIWAVFAAAASGFIAGGLWYSPALFGRAWMRETGLTEQQLAGSNMALIFGLSFVLSVIASFVFAMFLGPAPKWDFALMAGLSAGVAWVGASFGINYLFERKTLKLFIINAGYHTVQFALIGLILGLWH